LDGHFAHVSHIRSSGFGLKWTEGTNMEDDLYDIPVAYLLYVLLAIIVLIAGAAAAIVML
jgi:hypothetical protein